ncbi:MAG: hypothetical protein J4F31_07010 [Flavobacteriales bacterium]|nr:hypothetical protein [Flavobacteriales bacterium]
MRTLILKVVLVIVALGLAYWLYEIIQAPIRFEQQKNRRMEVVKEKLITIRTAQSAFKEVNGYFSPNFTDLVAFLDTGEFTLLQRRDSSFEAFNDLYQMMEIRDTVVIDTLGYKSIKDSLFAGYDLNSMKTIPFSGGKEFAMDAGRLEKEGGLVVQVFEARAPKEEYLKGLDRTLINTQAKDLQVGSLTEATLGGNWQ